VSPSLSLGRQSTPVRARQPFSAPVEYQTIIQEHQPPPIPAGAAERIEVILQTAEMRGEAQMNLTFALLLSARRITWIIQKEHRCAQLSKDQRMRKLARLLFCYYNSPGSEVISGPQDSVGIIFPGLAKAEWRLRLQIAICVLCLLDFQQV
jgi:hypothetical protein